MDYIVKIINKWQDIIDKLLLRLPLSKVHKYLLYDISLDRIVPLPFKVRLITIFGMLLFIAYSIITVRFLFKMLFSHYKTPIPIEQNNNTTEQERIHTTINENIDKEVIPPMINKERNNTITNELDNAIIDDRADNYNLGDLSLKNLTPKEYKKAKKEQAKLLKKKGKTRDKKSSLDTDTPSIAPRQVREMDDELDYIENTPTITLDDSLDSQDILKDTLEENKEMFSDPLDRFLHEEETEAEQHQDSKESIESNSINTQPEDIPIDNSDNKPIDNTKSQPDSNNDLEEILDFFRE